MRTNVWLAVGVSLGLLGCGVDATAEISEEGDAVASQDLSTTQYSFVIARRDNRRCISPLCGGYWVKDLNSTMQERYVSAFDFSQTNLSADAQDALTGAPDHELVLLARLGPKESRFNTRTLVVSTGYRGLPGKTFSASDKFYGVFPSKIACFTTPCANLQTTRLNRTTGHAMATAVDVSKALAVLVDEQWLMSRVLSGKTVIAGTIARSGANVTVKASQVFVELPDRATACLVSTPPSCSSGTSASFVRTPDRCTEATGACTALGVCANHSVQCAAGYRQVSWQNVCPRHACEPEFLEP